MFIFSFYVNCLLRHVFDDSEENENHVEDNQEAKKKSYYIRIINNMLDLDGPTLFGGAKLWMLFYQYIGQINWLNKPLYLAIIYKLFVICIGLHVVLFRILIPLISINLLIVSFRNPINILITLLALTTASVQFLICIYINLFNLSPMFKIITTPKLCYLSREAQLIFGDRTFFMVSLLVIYNALLVRMLVCGNFQGFLDSFTLIGFLWDLFGQTVIWYCNVGMAHYDFYLRSSFACWILALKMNLESRFARFHVHQKRKLSELLKSLKSKTLNNKTKDRVLSITSYDLDRRSESRGLSFSSSSAHNTTLGNYIDVFSGYNNNTNDYKFITLDEIKRSLNNMDDHLEVWRITQTNSLVFISLNAFLVNGTLFLVAYNLIANERDYYHGLIILAIGVNYWILVSVCYYGDQWLSYALNRFVQTVEDEYFLQGADDDIEKLVPSLVNNSMDVIRRSQDLLNGSQLALTNLTENLIIQYKSLVINKRDVLFCREFSHQFKDHLATPWSNLTIKSHFHMLGTFVTLIAAQIIFDREHH